MFSQASLGCSRQTDAPPLFSLKGLGVTEVVPGLRTRHPLSWNQRFVTPAQVPGTSFLPSLQALNTPPSLQLWVQGFHSLLPSPGQGTPSLRKVRAHVKTTMQNRKSKVLAPAPTRAPSVTPIEGCGFPAERLNCYW